MSRTYDLGCKDCKESLWIGQGWPDKKRFIYKTENCLAALQKFLFDHEGHNLIFVDNEDIFQGEGERFDSDEYLQKKTLCGEHME